MISEEIGMRFEFCPDCGSRNIEKPLGDEGMVKWCEKCRKPWFDYSYTCILCAAVNEFGEIALIRQGYVSEEYYVGVAGHIKCGETAEQSVIREVTEEIGIVPESVSYIESSWYTKKGMLMLGFRADVKKSELVPSCEVDSARWFLPDDALKALREGSNIYNLVKKIINADK